MLVSGAVEAAIEPPTNSPITPSKFSVLFEIKKIYNVRDYFLFSQNNYAI